MHRVLEDYVKAMQREPQASGTTEHTHRPALKALVQAMGKNVLATNEPGRIECGAPDFRVSRGQLCIGYIETKDIATSLAEAQREEQLKRYIRSLPNLLLTDYVEFRWFVDGELRRKARLGDLVTDSSFRADEKSERDVIEVIDGFLSHTAPPVSRPKELAVRMARLTHLIRDMIVDSFDKGKVSATLKDLRQAFAKALIPDLEEPEKTDEFADMYAQTIAYGLFAARCNHPAGKPFRRVDAAREIPKTNPFLRRLFETVTGTSLDEELYADYVNDLVQLLDHAHMDLILEEFGKRSRHKDPVVHFYETFLATYDPELRERRGVYYTPEPVVSFIVRSVEKLLHRPFGLKGGLGDESKVTYERKGANGAQTFTAPKVLILDPACGTGTFLYWVVDRIRDRFIGSKNAGMWPGYVRTQLLPRLYGFELLMAPYAVAHFKLGMQLAALDLTALQRRAWAYDFGGSERLGVYLTNTLEAAEIAVETLYGPLRIITEEANAARAVKRDLPILVVMGNPPYSGQSANRSWEIKDGKRVQTHIGKLLQDYYVVDGAPLGEKNPKWLQDDYVKFIRWGQWRIEQTGAGVLAFITNHSYLDNPTFRGMRQQLMNAFTEIYILDLHGNYKKKEVAPDGSKDENVFDIQQGVAIGLFVKAPGKSGPAKVFHAELWGPCETEEKPGGKYHWLSHNDVRSTIWAELEPESPTYLFKPQQKGLLKEYERGWKITEVMPESSVGIVTARDALTIGFTADELWDRVQDFARLSPEEARRTYDLGPDTRDWKVELAQEDIRASGPRRENVVPILYRPFDVRYTYYTGHSRGFICMPRPEVMRNVLAGPNVGLISARSNKSPDPDHFLVSRFLTEAKCGESTTQSCFFPLWLYPDPKKNGDLFTNGKARHSNLSEGFMRAVSDALRLSFSEEAAGDLKRNLGALDVLAYAYAVFHSRVYRSRYGQFLKIDFPRVPIVSDRSLFRDLCRMGQRLISLHLLDFGPNEVTTHFPIKGSDSIDDGFPLFAPMKARGPRGREINLGYRVYVNQEQSFERVLPEAWAYRIGGYQVCEKWLKDRRGRKLSHDDLVHYQKVVTAIQETIRILAQIDETIPKWPIK